MKERIKSIFPCIELYTVSVLFVLSFLVLFISSVLCTVIMGIDNPANEQPYFVLDNIVLNILGLLVFFAAVALFLFLIRRVNVKLLFVIVPLLVIAAGFAWVFSILSCPSGDSHSVTNAALQASLGEYAWASRAYFKYYPFQLGYVLFCEGFLRLFSSPERMICLQLVNVVCLAITYFALLKLSLYILGERCAKICAFVFLLIPQPILFCTFTYGNIPGFMFSCLSLLFLMYSLKSERLARTLIFSLLSALCVGCAVSVKLNNSIVLLAEIIYVVFYTVKNKKQLLLRGASVLLLLFCTITAKALPVFVYENRSGVDFGDGIPMVGWLAMGLHESAMAPGWYDDEYTVQSYIRFGGDGEKISERALSAIEDRAKVFSSDMGYTLRFFGEKLLTQCNDPTYQSIWTNRVRSTYEPRGRIAAFVLSSGRKYVEQYMNLVQQFIFFACLLGGIYCIKNKNKDITLLMLVVIGGILYHLLFEAKSQYFITYFILLVPICSYGLDMLLSDVKRLIAKGMKKWQTKKAA